MDKELENKFNELFIEFLQQNGLKLKFNSMGEYYFSTGKIGLKDKDKINSFLYRTVSCLNRKHETVFLNFIQHCLSKDEKLSLEVLKLKIPHADNYTSNYEYNNFIDRVCNLLIPVPKTLYKFFSSLDMNINFHKLPEIIPYLEDDAKKKIILKAYRAKEFQKIENQKIVYDIVKSNQALNLNELKFPLIKENISIQEIFDETQKHKIMKIRFNPMTLFSLNNPKNSSDISAMNQRINFAAQYLINYEGKNISAYSANIKDPHLAITKPQVLEIEHQNSDEIFIERVFKSLLLTVVKKDIDLSQSKEVMHNIVENVKKEILKEQLDSNLAEKPNLSVRVKI